MRVTFDGNAFRVRVSGPNFRHQVADIRTLAGAYFSPAEGVWYAKATHENYEALEGFDGSVLDQKARDWQPPAAGDYTGRKTPFADIDSSLLTPVNPEDPDHPKTFYPFQVLGTAFLEAVKGRGIVGDEMGLGKTVQALGFYRLHPDIRPVLVVCPATAKGVWAEHIWEWLGEEVTLLYGMDPKNREIPSTPWYVLNYDILGKPNETFRHDKRRKRYRPSDIDGWVEYFRDIRAVIADEAHHLSNPETIRTTAFANLLIGADFLQEGPVTPVSGTIMRDKPRDFFTSLKIVAPSDFSNRYAYYDRYCEPKERWIYRGRRRQRVMTYDGGTNLEELYARVRPYMVRRTKKEVLPDLPPKIRAVVPMDREPIDKAKFPNASDEFRAWVDYHREKLREEEETGEEPMLVIQYQRAYIEKRNAVIAWVKEYLSTDRKLVLFAYHHKVLDDLEREFEKGSVRVDGSTPSTRRTEAEKSFQTDEGVRLFLGQIDAAKEALTLTAAPATAFVEFSRLASWHLQAEDRVHRLTQEADSVMAYYLIARGTADDRAMETISAHADVVKRVLDGEPVPEFFPDSLQSKMLEE